jgi:hypothetical protein
MVLRQFQPVAFEVEGLDDIGMQPVQHMGDRRHAKTRREFFGARRAAELGSGFEHQHLAAGFREGRRANEAVVAAADDDDVIGCHAAGSVDGRALHLSTPTPVRFADHLSPDQRGRGSHAPASPVKWEGQAAAFSSPPGRGRGGLRSKPEWGRCSHAFLFPAGRGDASHCRSNPTRLALLATLPSRGRERLRPSQITSWAGLM